jgi:hypothetical protein
MMDNPFLRDLGSYARHLKPYLERFPAENILVIQFDAIRRDPDSVRRRTYEFLKVDPDFKPQLSEKGKNAARAPRFPLIQSAAQGLYNGVSALPVVGKAMKSSVVAKTLQGVYHRLNSKDQKYETLSSEDRAKWEKYYAADQEELRSLLQTVEVVE